LQATLVENVVLTTLKLGSIGTAGILCAVLASSAAFADDASTHSAGVWQKHEYSFQFMGFTTTYSCDGLADKLKTLLIASGARSDAKARAGACASGFGRPDKFARADLTFYTLAPAGSAPAGSSASDSRTRHRRLRTGGTVSLQRAGDVHHAQRRKPHHVRSASTFRVQYRSQIRLLRRTRQGRAAEACLENF
jgi:hypothetical protein